jgi:hypothetical protein
MFTQLQEIKSLNISKGFYANNLQNRKLGRVGKEYDIKKEELELKPVFKNYYDKRIDGELNKFLYNNKANLKHFSIFLEAFDKEISEGKIKNPLKFLVNLCGGFMSDNIRINRFDIFKFKNNILNISLNTDKFIVTREINLNKRELGPGLIDVKNVDKPENGLGYKMFYNEIETAYNNGFKNFRIYAGGDYTTKNTPDSKNKLNGYEFWGKLGFDLDEKLPHLNFSEAIYDTIYKNCKGILDLYSKSGGYEFWVKKGGSIHMNFNLSHSKDNKQIKVLKKYNEDYVRKFGTGSN